MVHLGRGYCGGVGWYHIGYVAGVLRGGIETMKLGRLEIKYQGRKFTIDQGWVWTVIWRGPFEVQAKKLDDMRMVGETKAMPPSLDTIA